MDIRSILHMFISSKVHSPASSLENFSKPTEQREAKKHQESKNV